MNITKDMILLYTLGQIRNPDVLAKIEAAAESDPVVRQWMRQLGPDPVDLPEPLERLATRMADELKFMKWISWVVDQPNDDVISPSARANVVQSDPAAWGGAKETMDFAEQLGGSSPERRFSTGPSSEDLKQKLYGQDDDLLFIRCEEHVLPAGLCWLLVIVGDDQVTRLLPRLELNQGFWEWSQPIVDVLGDKSPELPIVETCLMPATAETRSLFENEHVRQFIASLPADSPQRNLAVAYLEETEEPEHE